MPIPTKTLKRNCARIAFLVFLISPTLPALELTNARLASEPAISSEQLVFAYANDLWIAHRDGGSVRRLTSHAGVESGPAFSPDGSLIAFTGRYEGNTDVYLVPPRAASRAGSPIIQAKIPPSGSPRTASPCCSPPAAKFTPGATPNCSPSRSAVDFPPASRSRTPARAAISPDGRTIAYVPLREQFRQWKHYRGGTVARILLFDVNTFETQQIPQPESRCNDTDPTWLGNQLHFRSDRDGEFNLYAYDSRTRTVRRLTHHQDFPVLHASAGGGQIVYEQAGYLHRFDPASGSSTQLELEIAADLVELRPRWVQGCQMDP
jgi:tricorn protease